MRGPALRAAVRFRAWCRSPRAGRRPAGAADASDAPTVLRRAARRSVAAPGSRGYPAAAPARSAADGRADSRADGTAPRVLLLAFATRRVRAVCEDAEFLTARGIGVDLLTVNPQPWEDSGLPAAVRYWSLRRGEGYHPLPRGERLLVYRAPRKVLGLLRNAAEPHYGHPDLGRPLELAVGAAVRAHARLADGFHHRVFIRGYRVLRPYLLWRIASRDPGAALVTQSTERVVVYDTHAVPTAWHLARRHPRLQVDLGFDRARYGDLPVRDAQPQARPQAVAEEETAR